MKLQYGHDHAPWTCTCSMKLDLTGFVLFRFILLFWRKKYFLPFRFDEISPYFLRNKFLFCHLISAKYFVAGEPKRQRFLNDIWIRVNFFSWNIVFILKFIHWYLQIRHRYPLLLATKHVLTVLPSTCLIGLENIGSVYPLCLWSS
jgi:hypothetical protein